MANLLVTLSHGRGIGTLGAKSSPSKGSVNKKLTPVQYRPVRSQIRRRLKLVANSSAGSPAYRLTEEGKEPTLKASWWDTTPHDHVVNYIASCLYPMRGGQIRAAGMFYSVGNFWLTWVPVLIWLCSGLRIGFIPAYAFVSGVAIVAMYFNKFCTWHIRIRESKKLSGKLSKDTATEQSPRDSVWRLAEVFVPFAALFLSMYIHIS